MYILNYEAKIVFQEIWSFIFSTRLNFSIEIKERDKKWWFNCLFYKKTICSPSKIKQAKFCEKKMRIQSYCLTSQYSHLFNKNGDIIFHFDFFHPPLKVIYTKYSKHWLYTVAHTIECVCSKMNNSWFNPWFSFYFSSLCPAPYIERYIC